MGAMSSDELMADASRPLLVALLPVRNGDRDLPGYLDGVRPFVDAVVALDDGSTDSTRAILDADPLVSTVLTNPQRDSYTGWHDGANRNRLLEAAGAIRPRWILSLDVDERVDEVEGLALRQFLGDGALDGLVYGLLVFRSFGGFDDVDPRGWWVYRVFAWRPDARFPDRRLHFDPIPDDVPPSRKVTTTLRIRHLAGESIERRTERARKYQEVDPNQKYGFTYPDLADDVEPVPWTPWQGPSVLPGVPAQDDPAAAEPALSAIVISRDDGDRIRRSLTSVVNQECDDEIEVIAVVSGGGNAGAIVRSEFPSVALVELPEPALPGVARNAGLRVARGDYVSFPGSHIELPPGSLAARISAHDAGYTMVTGTTLNGTHTSAGWASYFLDHSTVLPGRPSADLDGPPAHCSYVRRALVSVGGFPEHLRAGEDTVVNHRLAASGATSRRAKDVQLIHHTRCTTVWRLLRHHQVRGRSYGRILLDEHRVRGGLLFERSVFRLFDIQVRSRVGAIDRNVRAWGDGGLVGRYRRVRRLVVAAAVAHWLGALVELGRPAHGRWAVLLSKPVVTMVDCESQPNVVARIDLVSRRVKIVEITFGLEGSEVDLDASVHDAAGVRWPATRRGWWRVLVDRSIPIGVRLPVAWSRLFTPACRIHRARFDGDDIDRQLDTRAYEERRRARVAT